MAQGTKIRWSPGELTAALSPDFFYVKHAVIGKVVGILSDYSEELKNAADLFPALKEYTDTKTPKLFKGENYLQLPYVVLDFPRKFSGASVFAFRSMFWWGKEFSFTLHIQGDALDGLRDGISNRIHNLHGKDFFVCVNASPWQYHFEKDNYQRLDEFTGSAITGQGPDRTGFIKISRRLPVSDYEKVSVYGLETFKLLGEVLFGLGES